MTSHHIAIIGAGLAGSVLANELAHHGVQVTVFEKSRGTGGRLSSARLGALTADLGAPALSPDTPEFGHWLSQQYGLGILKRWQARCSDFELTLPVEQTFYTGDNRLSTLTRHLLNHERIQLKTQTRISQICPVPQGQQLKDELHNECGVFDHVVVATPAPQASLLLEQLPAFQQLSRQVVPEVQWVCLLALEKPVSLPIDHCMGEHPILSKVVRESAKPGRDNDPQEVWAIHADTRWSEAHAESDPDWVSDQLKDAFASLIGEPGVWPLQQRCHRWLYSTCSSLELEQPWLHAPDQGISVCGDWLKGHGFSASWHSAMALSQHLLQALFADQTSLVASGTADASDTCEASDAGGAVDTGGADTAGMDSIVESA